ncbi:MAG: Trk system potassium transporter TrkA [Clostridia bacterium]|nr:Trk system potassium transporter TrkA [Clostridia bacterium]
MNIIVVGLGKVGEKLVERLSREENHNITAIDIKRDVLQDTVNSYDVMGVFGSGASVDVLSEAGIEDTDIFIAATASDELNLFACLLARKLNSGCSTIARVRNPEYSKELHLFKEDLGLAMIINPEHTAANEIARALRFPSAVQIDTFAKGRVEILKFKIQQGSPLANLKVADIKNRLSSDVLVCGVERGDDAFIPGGDFVMEEGDFISIVATIKDAAAFIKKIGIKTNKVKDTIIVGGGATAVYLAKNLIKSGIEVKIIEQNQARCELLCDLLPKATIINGDGTENRLLLEEGIENAESFVSLTNIDEENVMLSLYAKTKTDGKVVTKINRIAYDEVIRNLGLDTIIYPKNTAAEYIVRFVRAKNNSIGSNIETMHYVLDGKAEALEFRIVENSPISNQTIESLSLKDDIIIACINRAGKIITPRGKDVILTGDRVIVVTTHKGFKDISDILR